MKVLKLDLVFLMTLFYPMLAIVILTGLTGNWWLALLALSIFLVTMVAVNVDRNMIKI